MIKENCDSTKIDSIIRKKILEKYVYLDDTICRSQIMSNTILSKLLDIFIPAVLEYNLDKQSELNKRIICLFSDNYKKVLDKTINGKTSDSPEAIYNKILLATDYICGMTDSYAQQMYNMVVALPVNS